MISKPESRELREYVLSFNPDCIINSRVGHNMGDYLVLEQNISKESISKPWESCITMGRNWGYIEYDTVYKSPEVLVRQLLDIVSKGGNYLLNNGPKPDGTMTEKAVENLKIVGKWMRKNAEGIYGTSPWKQASEIPKSQETQKDSKSKPEKNTMKDAENDATSKTVFPQVFFTQKEGAVYAFVSSWNGKTALIKSLATGRFKKIKKVELVGTSKTVGWKQTPEGLSLSLPEYKRNKIPISGFKISAE
ncbi:MAG: alpha-L-fucosidase, partial [Cytophagales bacterium]|nr:alpha-L-fucosidase [Cytophagales bacterium]